MLKKIVALFVVGASLGACFPQGECSTPYREYCAAGDTTCQGHIIDATHWETGPVSGEWLMYGPEGTLLMHLRDAVTGQVLSGQIVGFQSYVGAVAQQDAGGILPAVCAGMLCEELQTDSSSFVVRNDTCATQYFYAVVTIVPDAPTDAGAD